VVSAPMASTSILPTTGSPAGTWRCAGPTTSWCWTSCCPPRALARRTGRGRPAILRAGELTLDPGRHRVCRDGTEISLTAREFAVLHHLLRNPDVVLSKSAILEAVWDSAFDGDVNIVKVYIG
jgi:hypothetical protein